MPKLMKEKFKTYGDVFDQHTIRNLFVLSSQGLFDELRSPISIGKEANVFSADHGDGVVCVKIYRLETCDFNKMYDYIKFDERYIHLKGKKRQIIFAWCQREYRNLLKVREAGVRVPTPYKFKDNILVMEHIGDDGASPQLKDAIPDNPEVFMDKVIENMRKMLKDKLVHGDLSEFNILNYNEEPIFIDFSQSTTTKSLNARDLLERDCKNIARFFTKHGAKITADDIKKRILKK